MKRGIACICLSAFGFSLMALFVRLADVVGEPLPSIEKAFFRNLCAFVIASGVLAGAVRRGALPLRALQPRDWVDLALRSTFGTCGIFANFYALSLIPIADAMTLNKLAPFVTLLASWALVGERMSRRSAFCVLGAFGGALFVIKPGFADGLSHGSFVGFLSGVCAGVAYAFVHRLGRRGVPAPFIVFFFSLFSTLACVPFMILWGRPMSLVQVAVLVAAGLGATLGQFGITWAYRAAEPRQVAVYDYSGILFTALFGFFVFGQVPDALSLVGFAVIILMAVLAFAIRTRTFPPLQSGRASAIL